jgi:hypothetical protein
MLLQHNTPQPKPKGDLKMNKELQNHARAKIKDGLSALPESHTTLFKRMYSHNDPTLPIEEVVNNMDESNLDWAMQQVQRTLDKLTKG